ncbi:MAG: hypothetical protein AB1400_05790 [Pseudomonadota bacterium]
MQIHEPNIKVRNWRVIAGLLGLIAAYAIVGKFDSDARLAEAERIAELQPRIVVPAPQAKPSVPLQRQAAIGRTCGGVM